MTVRKLPLPFQPPKWSPLDRVWKSRCRATLFVCYPEIKPRAESQNTVAFLWAQVSGLFICVVVTEPRKSFVSPAEEVRHLGKELEEQGQPETQGSDSGRCSWPEYGVCTGTHGCPLKVESQIGRIGNARFSLCFPESPVASISMWPIKKGCTKQHTGACSYRLTYILDSPTSTPHSLPSHQAHGSNQDLHGFIRNFTALIHQQNLPYQHTVSLLYSCCHTLSTKENKISRRLSPCTPKLY